MPFRSQPAMEYLMTYGWAVLAIAIVIIALFQLGVFNGTNLSSHASAGACQAVHTAAGSSLAGQCNNQPPQFVAQFNGNGYLLLPSATFNYPTSGSTNSYFLTFSAWFKTSESGAIFAQDDNVMPGGAPGGWVPAIYLDSNGFIRSSVFWHGSTSSQLVTPVSYNNSNWHQIVDTYSNGVESLYLDGQFVGSQSTSEESYNNQYLYFIGTGYATSWPYANGWMYFNGMVSNLQVYNTSLSPTEITALYQEGIGGSPIDPTHIVGWWPLNGNAQDYSGNNNFGVAVGGVSYSSAWTSGYVAP